MIDRFIRDIKRADTPFFRALKNFARALMTSTLPLPGFMLGFYRFLYHVQEAVVFAGGWLLRYFYVEPTFRARCVSVGKHFYLSRQPFVIGHASIYLGDDVNFFGKVNIISGRLFDEPKLILHNRVDIGHNVGFVVNLLIEIGDDVNVASGVQFMDSDAHPRDVADRIADLPPQPEEIKPVKVGRYAWIGQNSFILKGVTIGEGAIVGVNSVVVTDVPPYSIVMGNPARVVMKNIQKPLETV